MKMTIEKVTNGYIVRWIRTGMSALKNPYERPVMVFESFVSLLRYIEQSLKNGKME